MHIVFVEFVTHFGGAPRSSVEFAARLAQHVRVSMIDPYGCCGEFRDAVSDTAVEYHVLDRRAGSVIIGGHGNPLARAGCLVRAVPGLLRLRHRAARKILAIGGTVVCSNNPKSLMLAATSFRLRRLPLVGYLRGWYPPDMIPPYARWLYRRRCSVLFAVSTATKASLVCSGVDPARLVVLHNPVDVADLCARAARPLDETLPQRHRPVRLVVPAGLMQTKGQHTAVRALGRLVNRGCDAVLWLAGDVAEGGDASYVTRTKALAESLGVADRVCWLGLRSDVPQVMNAATAVVLPTHTEGFGRVILEAMALERPVVATLVGGITDLILPGVTGLNFEVEDDAGLAECILTLERDRSLGDRIVSNAFDYARTSPRFNTEYHTQRALEVFARLSKNGR